MSEFEREEDAFREAMIRYAPEAVAPVRVLRQRRVRRFAPLVAAASVVAVIAVTVVVIGDSHDRGTPDSTGPSGSAALGPDPQWIGMRGVEVLAPGSWPMDVPALRPDCIQDDPGPEPDPWAKDVPAAPYVSVGGDDRPVPLVGCFSDPKPWDPNPAFGHLPFRLWQPYVALAAARPDLATQQPSRRDGVYAYAGWTLTRTTIAGVQISVLAAPDHEGLGQAVIDSAREVTTTHDGCAVRSQVLNSRVERPDGAPVPTDGIAAVTLCDYSRNSDGIGLSGSRRIAGKAAQNLADAFHRAPAGAGPEGPVDCQEGGGVIEHALVLRYFATAEDTTKPIADAYVYFDSCIGNGVVDASGPRQLTRENCSPLFAEPPIQMGGAWSPVYRRCAILAGHG